MGLYGTQYTVYNTQYTAYTIFSIQYTELGLYGTQYTIYSVLYIIYNIQYTVCTKFVLLNQPFGSRLHIHTTCTKVNVQKKEMVFFIFYIFNTGNLRWRPYFVKMWGSNNTNSYLGNAQMHCASTIMGLPLVWYQADYHPPFLEKEKTKVFFLLHIANEPINANPVTRVSDVYYSGNRNGQYCFTAAAVTDFLGHCAH